MDHATFAKLLRKWRESNGYSQRDAADPTHPNYGTPVNLYGVGAIYSAAAALVGSAALRLGEQALEFLPHPLAGRRQRRKRSGVIGVIECRSEGGATHLVDRQHMSLAIAMQLHGVLGATQQHFRDLAMRSRLEAGKTYEGHVLIPRTEGGRFVEVTINGNGEYVFALAGQIDHPTAGGENQLQLAFGVNVNDGSGTANAVGTGTLNIIVEDDSHLAAVSSGKLVNSVGSTLLGSAFDLGGDVLGSSFSVTGNALPTTLKSEGLAVNYSGAGTSQITCSLGGRSSPGCTTAGTGAEVTRNAVLASPVLQ